MDTKYVGMAYIYLMLVGTITTEILQCPESNSIMPSVPMPSVHNTMSVPMSSVPMSRQNYERAASKHKAEASKSGDLFGGSPVFLLRPKRK